MFVPALGFAQAVYGPQGQYQGYSQTSPSGVTNVYNAQGHQNQTMPCLVRGIFF
jgi:hypothetical protein